MAPSFEEGHKQTDSVEGGVLPGTGASVTISRTSLNTVSYSVKQRRGLDFRVTREMQQAPALI